MGCSLGNASPVLQDGGYDEKIQANDCVGLVYGNGPLRRAVGIGGANLFGARYGGGHVAVSYTHLDVYKRQPSNPAILPRE